MATYNILSSCICRDGFGFREDNRHQILTFLQSTSPITWFELNNKPKYPITMDYFSNIEIKNFRKKCIINDYNKTVLNAYIDKSDFFITDLVSFAVANLAREIRNNEEIHYFTYSKWFREAYEKGLKEYLPYKIEIVNRFDLIDEALIENTIDNYVKWIISKGYKQNQVILVENKKVLSYSDGELLYYFENQESRNKINEVLDKIYDCFEKKMPECYVVKMPFGVYSDVHHKWGLTDLHFCKEYYDYLYECFDLVSEKKNCQNEIDKLREKYSTILSIQKDKFMQNNWNYMDIKEKQLLVGIIKSELSERIAKKGAKCFDVKTKSITEYRLEKYYVVSQYDKNYSIVTLKGNKYLVSNDECVKGFCGKDKIINENWKTINASTLAILKEDSIVIGHSGIKSQAQMQIIRTIISEENLYGKIVNFSVWARVLQCNDEGKGGTIGIINAEDYNKGKFFAKLDFNNREWEKLTISVKLPKKQNFKGLTICLRALANRNEEALEYAMVEFGELELCVVAPKGETNPKRRK